MSWHYSSLVGSTMRGAMLAALTLAFAGCGEEPKPPRLIGFSPDVLSVPAHETLPISVEYEENDFALQNFQWSADAGEIEGNGAPSVTYHAPADPGDYKISVTVGYGDNQTLSVDSLIKVTQAIGSSAPPVFATGRSGWRTSLDVTASTCATTSRTSTC